MGAYFADTGITQHRAWAPSTLLTCIGLNIVNGPIVRDLGKYAGYRYFGVETATSYRQAHWKGWGASTPTFSSGFCGRRGPLRPHKLPTSGPEAPLRNLKY